MQIVGMQSIPPSMVGILIDAAWLGLKPGTKTDHFATV